jgi:hypothetical protein
MSEKLVEEVSPFVKIQPVRETNIAREIQDQRLDGRSQ